MDRKKPLYRKENKVSLCTKYYVKTGSEFRYSRNTKDMKNFDGNKQSMKKGKYGYDYAPLYKFLQSKVGQKWDDVYSEAKSRLDKTEPIFWLVDLELDEDSSPVARFTEATYYSRMYVDDNGLLQFIDKSVRPSFACTCCTHSFNGKAMTVADGTPQDKSFTKIYGLTIDLG